MGVLFTVYIRMRWKNSSIPKNHSFIIKNVNDNSARYKRIAYSSFYSASKEARCFLKILKLKKAGFFHAREIYTSKKTKAASAAFVLVRLNLFGNFHAKIISLLPGWMLDMLACLFSDSNVSGVI